MPAILTFDLGTTYFKVCLFDQRGNLLAVQRVAPPITHPQKNWCELTVADFRQTIRQAVAALGKSAPGGLGEVAAVSFATQANSFCLLDSAGVPITPLILWSDERAAELSEQVHAITQTPGYRALTGVPDLTPIFMAAKLLWMAKHQPAVLGRASRLCLMSDYLTLWLTGNHVTEAGTACLSGLVDVHQLAWSPSLYEQVGLRADMLPRVARAGTDVGRIRPEAAQELGLPPACRMVVGCLDQYAGAIGAGNIAVGGVSETTGTVLAAVRCASDIDAKADPGEYQGPSFAPGSFYRMSFGSTSANLLEWYRSQLPDRPDFEALGAAAAQIKPGAEGLKVKVRADLGTLETGFIGMNATHGRGHAVRAIMETVAFALRDHIATLCADAPPALIRSSGGAARSDLWLQIKADVLNVPFVATTCPEPTSLGAALLAAKSLGWRSMDELVQQWVRTKPPHMPDPAMHAALYANR